MVVARKLNYPFCSARLAYPAYEQNILAEESSPYLKDQRMLLFLLRIVKHY